MRLTAILIVFLLSFSLVHAETDNVLKSQKVSLDEKLRPFLIQINATLSFAEKKGVDVTNLQNLTEQFESKIKEAMDAESKEEFKLKYDDLKYIASKIKKEVKRSFKEYVEELKAEIKQKLEDEKEHIEIKVENETNKILEKKVINKVEEVKSLFINETIKMNLTSKNETNISIELPKAEKVKETSKSLWEAFLEHLRSLDED